MAKKVVRSEYIKQLMTESNNLEEKLKNVAESTINTILEEKTNKNLRQILSEDQNSFSEEDVDDNTPLGSSDDSNAEGAGDGAGNVEGDGNNSADNGEWDDLEQYKDEDGEYDLRGMSKEELVKVLKTMSPDDAVRIVKNEDDSLTVTEEGDGQEYELELGNGDDDLEGDGEIEYEIETDDDFADDDNYDNDDDETEFEVELDEANLGYTDKYQRQSAMTVDNNDETANPKSTYSMDGGVPKGTSKPWVGPKKKAPFNTNVNECGDANMGNEQPVEEGLHTTAEHSAAVNGTTSSYTPDTNSNRPGRNARVNGQQVTNTGDNPYQATNEAIKKKANEIFLENKQLKALTNALKERVNEAIVVNQSLGNMIKLITENATTVNEKKEILRRFNECATREESNKLYTVISEELKRDGKTHANVADTINSQLSESRSRAVETPMYQSQDLSETLSFMQRLDAIK